MIENSVLFYSSSRYNNVSLTHYGWVIKKSRALVRSLINIACLRILFIFLLKYHDHFAKMKQNRVYVICKKLFTTVKELKLHVASCSIRNKKLNKKMLKRMIKNLVLLTAKAFRKKTETTYEFNDYILKKEKIWIDVSFKSEKNNYFEL